MLIEIPPKYSGAQVVGYIKGKSAIAIARRCVGKQKNVILCEFHGNKRTGFFLGRLFLVLI
jgi:REP element-mobilizing transposase RayT